MPRRSRSRIAASEWQAGPMVQMILARRAAGDEREDSALTEFSVASCSFLDFTLLLSVPRKTRPRCHPERSERTWFLFVLPETPRQQASTKIPRFARDDKRTFRSATQSANSLPWVRSPQSVLFPAWCGEIASR